MSSFENLRIVDNFYQTSLFFPMPTVVISTLCEDGSTTLGPYSLVQPYYVAGKDYYAMLLSCLHSMWEMGYAYAIIGWADEPAPFYEKTVGAIPIPDSHPAIYKNLVRK